MSLSLAYAMRQSSLPNLVTSAISAKCGSIVSLSIAWRSAALKALDAGASPKTVACLIEGFQSPRVFDSLLASVAEEETGLDGFLEKLQTLVDGSAFDLASWLAALEIVKAFLLQSGRFASSASMLGYLQCSAEFGDSPGGRDGLVAIVTSMLDQYGFEGQEGCVT